jgi:hypothetical protein
MKPLPTEYVKINGRWLKRSSIKRKGTKGSKNKKDKSSKNRRPVISLSKRLKKNKELINLRFKHELTEGEKSVAEYLMKNGVVFYTEYYFHNLYNSKNNFLFFDFYIPAYNLVIEYDGAHHFKSYPDKEKYNKTRLHDKLKNAFCRKNCIHILRIPFFKSDQMENMICDKFDQIDTICYSTTGKWH